jgi:Ca2+-binding EF-hand superfamily protein
LTSAFESIGIDSKIINFETFLKVLTRPDGFKAAGTKQDFINGFKVFDKEGNGHITVGELRYGREEEDSCRVDSCPF